MRYNPKAKIDPKQVEDKRRVGRPGGGNLYYDRFDDQTRDRKKDSSQWGWKLNPSSPKTNMRGGVQKYFNREAAHSRGVQNGTSMQLRRKAMEKRLKGNG